MTLQVRTQALLDLVEADRQTQCDAIAAQAQARALALRAQAGAEARARVRESFAELRARERATLAAARAELQTRLRLHEQRRVEALLALGWQQLPAALRARWHDAATRGAWIEHALASARAVLPRGPWQLSIGPPLESDEEQALARRLEHELGAAPQLRVADEIEAGLRIVTAGIVLDATLAGLLADRDEVGGQLLGLLEKTS